MKIAITKIAALEAVTLLAKALGKSPVVIAIAMIAKLAIRGRPRESPEPFSAGPMPTLLKAAERSVL